MIRFLSSTCLLALALPAMAAVVPGKAAAPDPEPAIGLKRAPARPARAPQVRLAPLPAMAANHLAEDASSQEKRVRIGARRDVRGEAESREMAQPAWQEGLDGRWRATLAVASPGAAALRLGIALRALPAGSEISAWGDAASAPPAPVGAAAALEAARLQGLYWTPITEGESQVIEIALAAGQMPDAAKFEVIEVSHLAASAAQRFKASSGVGASQACHEDVACVAPANAAIARAARSVAKLVFTENGATYMCSGTLISDGDAASQVPYLYTAAHCIGSQAAAATLNTFWFFEAAACNNKAAAAYRQLAGGATLLHADAASDAALVRLSDRAPEGAWFSGWDDAPLAEGTAIVGLHHPAGDFKKVSIGKALPATAASTGASYATTAWLSGSTEGGSSGSGVFSLAGSEYVLRGGLKGGSASCTTSGRLDDLANRDYYSRLDRVAGTLRPWLAAAAAPLEDYTDMWWNPNESGWGLSIVQQPDNKAFVIWYTYDRDGTSAWFSIPDPKWSTAFRLEGEMYRTTGPAFDRSFVTKSVSVASAGRAVLDFAHDGTAKATFTVDGTTVVKAIQRFR